MPMPRSTRKGSSNKREITPAAARRALLRRRVIVLFCSLALALAVVTGQLFSLQVYRYPELIKAANGQTWRQVPSVARRGTIYDRNGRELAISIGTASIYARPAEIEDPDGASAALAASLGLPVKQIREQLRSKKSLIYIKRSAPLEEAEAVMRLALKGIGFDAQSRRFYPKAQQAAHLLGFVGTDDQGLEGLELQYDHFLAGKRKWVARQQDAKRRPIFREEADETQGADLHLTIDEVVQYITERELEAAVSQSGALSGSAIVMNPLSGEILALANYPTFDPNVYTEASAFARRNRAVVDYYEPGSTFKVIVGAGALEERLVRPEDRFNGEGGVIEVGGATIRDHERFDSLTFTEVLTHSSNVGAIKVGQRLGKSHYYDYISGFGFGTLTKIDLPGETPGLIRRPKEWSALSLASLSMGQEISVSPLQMLVAMSAIANGGVLVRPFIAKSIVAADGKVIRVNTPTQIRRVISEDTARTLATILKGVVTEGTGKAAAVEGFEVAGKTGTSQKIDRATRRYSRQKVVASFVGFVPVERPQLAIIVMIDEPSTLRWGGSIAAPTFREIARESLKHLRRSPTDQEPLRLAEGIRHATFRLD